MTSKSAHQAKRPSRVTMSAFAGICVLALVIVLGAVLVVPSGTSLARYFQEAGDGNSATVKSQGVKAATNQAYIDYGDWNWFDRQTNESSLQLKNDSPTALVATIKIADVGLAGPNAANASGKAKAWILDNVGAKQSISDNVTQTTAVKNFTANTLSWTVQPGQSTNVVIGTESKTSDLLSQTLVGVQGARFEFRFAVDWTIAGMSVAETSQLYPSGVLGPKPGDRANCPAGTTDPQQCQNLVATVKQPVLTVAEGDVSCRHDGARVLVAAYQKIYVSPTVKGFSGVQLQALQLTGNAGDYANGYTPMRGGGGWTNGTEATLKDWSALITFDQFDTSVRFVVRARGGSPGHVNAPDGVDRPTQSPVYEMRLADGGLFGRDTCSVSRVNP